MKVFLSWSGDRSRQVASLLSDWLGCVIQASRPWISTRDIDRGSLWFGEINDQLKDASVGVICLTQENKNRPWILFEAGALAKGLSTARVCTLLIDLQPKDIEDPLAQFNHTTPTKDSIFALVKTLNNALGSNGLDRRLLEQVFNTYWPQFEKEFNAILEKTKPEIPIKPRSEKDLLSEILDNTRSLNNRIRRLESEKENRKYTATGESSILNFNRSSSHRILALEMIENGSSVDDVMAFFNQNGVHISQELYKELDLKYKLKYVLEKIRQGEDK